MIAHGSWLVHASKAEFFLFFFLSSREVFVVVVVVLAVDAVVVCSMLLSFDLRVVEKRVVMVTVTLQWSLIK